jgi:hypothetical protein
MKVQREGVIFLLNDQEMVEILETKRAARIAPEV